MASAVDWLLRARHDSSVVLSAMVKKAEHITAISAARDAALANVQLPDIPSDN